jgi:transposase InsO family protein
LTDHAQLPDELKEQVVSIVEQTCARSRWTLAATLHALEVSRSSYHRWKCVLPGLSASRPVRRSFYEILDSEREAILSYARRHPEVRHRELAWRMLDDGVCAVSPSTVYRVLGEADLVCRWQPKRRAKGDGAPDLPTRPDQQWQTDIRYTKVAGRNYYLLSFIDVFSRYIVHHELLTRMDGLTVATEAQAAIETLPADAERPTIQSDHGSCFVAHEYAATLRENGVGRTLIRPHTPTDNGIIERFHRTLGEAYENHDPEDLQEARRIIAGIIDHYNHQRLHASLNYLRPIDVYREDPEALLAERRRKLDTAREFRKQENLKLRQQLLPLDAGQNVSYSRPAKVSV